jgi:regulation of enolase protein 1 (concanavalin A-like superfamily)
MVGKMQNRPSLEMDTTYYCFLKRNGHALVSKRGEKFAANRSDWSTYENFATMYDGVYDEMVAAGVAKRLDEKV